MARLLVALCVLFSSRLASAAPDGAARALVARWVDAQNRGDFETYRALYAPVFEGVRRSGVRTLKLDHDGWMRDRERMFRRPMRVTATVVKVSPGASTTVELVQTFMAGKFQDRGRKRLVLVDVGGHLAIAHEELLESLLPAEDPTRPRCEDQKLATRAGELVLKTCTTGERAEGEMFGVERTRTVTLSLAGAAPISLGTVGSGWEWDQVWTLAGVLDEPGGHERPAIVLLFADDNITDVRENGIEVRALAPALPLLWKNGDQLVNAEVEAKGERAIFRAYHIAVGRKISDEKWAERFKAEPVATELVLQTGKIVAR